MNTTKHILPKGSSCATSHSSCAMLIGKARKVKCDAIKPACTACKRSARFRHEDPEAVRCCYGVGRREKGVRGIGGQSTKEVTINEDLNTTSEMDGQAARELPKLESSPSPFENLELPCPPAIDPPSTSTLPSVDFQPNPPTSFSQQFSFSYDPYTLPLLPTDTTFAPLAVPSYSPYVFPSLENETPSKLSSIPLSAYNPLSLQSHVYLEKENMDEFLSSPSSMSSSDTLSLAGSCDSYDSLELNPFALIDELNLYDSSVPTSPHSTLSSSDDDCYNSPFTSSSKDFESLTLPMFPQPLEW